MILSKRVLALLLGTAAVVSGIAWLVAVAVFVARAADPVLPTPLTGVIMISLVGLTVGALVLQAQVRSDVRQQTFEAKIEHVRAQIEARLAEHHESQDARDGRIYFAITQAGKEAARLRQETEYLRESLEERTQDLRPRMVVAGAVALAADAAPAPDQLPADNVLAFEAGRRVERETRRP